MKEYIDREAVKKKIIEEKELYAERMMNPTSYDIGYCNGLTMAFSLLLNVPAADVVEVRHEKWEPMTVYKSECVCSWCGDMWPDSKTNYCPNCGAKMDKEE